MHHRFRFIVNVLIMASLAFSLAITGPITTALAAGVLVSRDTSNNDFFPDVSEAPDGTLLAVWVVDATKQVRVAMSSDGGASWSTEVPIASTASENYLDTPKIVFDQAGNAHVVYMAGLGTTRKVHYRFLPAGANPLVASNWLVGQSPCTGTCLTPDLVAGRDGFVYVLYESTNDYVGIRRVLGTSNNWGPERRVDINDRARGALAISPDNRIHVALYNVNDDRAVYARYTAYDAFNQEALADLGNTGETPDIFADGSNHVHIVFESNISGNGVAYREVVDNILQPANFTVFSGGNGQRMPTVSADGLGNVYVAWSVDLSSVSLAGIRERQRVNGVWQNPVLLAGSPTAKARYPQYGQSLYGAVNLVFIESNDTHFLHRADRSASLGPRYIDVTDGHIALGATEARTNWFFAEGFTGKYFDEYLTLQNPQAGPVAVSIRYFLEGAGFVDRHLTLQARSRTTVTVHSSTEGVGRDKAVSVQVAAAQPIIAERPMYFLYGNNIDGGHNAVGAAGPALAWYFAEGFTGTGFEQYITIQNPNSQDAAIKITYFLEDGTIRERFLTAPANQRKTVTVHAAQSAGNPGGLGPGLANSAKLESQNGVGFVAERPMYFNYAGLKGGHNAVGATAPAQDWYFAEGYTGQGFDEYITIQNPGAAGQATITYYVEGETDPVQRVVPLKANSRTTVSVHAPQSAGNPGGYGRTESGKGISAWVHTNVPTIAERPMYFTYGISGIDGGHNVVGANAPDDTWYFAEGFTGEGFDQYVTIQNPSKDEGLATLEYFVQGQANSVKKTVLLAPESRFTVSVHEELAPGGLGRKAVGNSLTVRVTKTANGQPLPVVVERPMYFTYTSTFID